MKILGIVGSPRRLGNTEILVKEALKAAEKEGAEVSILRLSDLYILPCIGCLNCVRSEGICKLKDDLEWFLDLIKASDGLILGAPSYVGRPPGSFAMLEDRVAFPKLKGATHKKAVTIGVAGGTHIAWWVIPQLNFFVHLLGTELVGSFLAGSQGPGEVLFPERHIIIEEVHRLGRDLVFSLRGETDRLSDGAYKLREWNWHSFGYGEEKLTTVENCCPFCFSQAFTLYHGDQLPAAEAKEKDGKEIVCAFCHNSVGEIFTEGDKYVVRLKTARDEEGMRRWLEDHTQDWVAASIPLYLERVNEIKEKRAAYKSIMPWLKPSSTQGG